MTLNSDIAPGLEKLGFDPWFLENAGPFPEEFDVARVVAVHKDSFTLNNGFGDVMAELVGKLMYNADSPLDYPAVGDWVLARFYDGGRLGIIEQVLPRKTLLKRKTPGKKTDIQVIAANIDEALVIQSLNEDFNINRLERYLVMINESRIRPVVLLSKCDLLDARQVEHRIQTIHRTMPHLTVHPFSSFGEMGLETVWECLSPGRTYCLLGSSGVGKTTLLNLLIGDDLFKTKSIREKNGKGRHSTTSRQLISLSNGAMVIDTPGMRELGNLSVTTGMVETFADIAALAGECRFSDCTHTVEKGCVVLKAMEDGQLSEQRYKNFIRLTKETAYNDMTYQEKRNKDKKLGKYYKSVLEGKKNRW